MRWQNRSRQDAIETRQRTANAANRDARIEPKPEEQVESPEEIMLKKLGLKTDMISGDYLYLKDINEFEDIQMYATVLEGSKPSHTYDEYEKQIESTTISRRTRNATILHAHTTTMRPILIKVTN